MSTIYTRRGFVCRHHEKENISGPSIEDFKITKISQTIIANSYFGYIAELRNQLQSSDVYEPLEVKNFVSCKNR